MDQRDLDDLAERLTKIEDRLSRLERQQPPTTKSRPRPTIMPAQKSVYGKSMGKSLGELLEGIGAPKLDS